MTSTSLEIQSNLKSFSFQAIFIETRPGSSCQQSGWIAIARDDIRDMMGISIHRINNYMIVATLILSVAAGALLSVSFSPECPGFIVFAFYLCTGISLMFLMESIMFGVKGQNSAFTNTMKLLTYQAGILPCRGCAGNCSVS